MRKNPVFWRPDNFHSLKTRSSSSNWKKWILPFLSILAHFHDCFPIKKQIELAIMLKSDKIQFFQFELEKLVLLLWKWSIREKTTFFLNFCRFWLLLTHIWVGNAQAGFGIFWNFRENDKNNFKTWNLLIEGSTPPATTMDL